MIVFSVEISFSYIRFYFEFTRGAWSFFIELQENVKLPPGAKAASDESLDDIFARVTCPSSLPIK